MKMSVLAGYSSDFKKAKLLILDDKGSKQGEFEVLFNPAEYSISDRPSFSETRVAGEDNPIISFTAGSSSSLSMTLYFDGYHMAVQEMTVPKDLVPMDVSVITDELRKLATVDGKLHHPPICEFSWGSLAFRGFVEHINTTFTMFTGSGKAIRAKMDITFISSLDKSLSAKKKPKFSPDRTKRYVLHEGMQLYQVAYDEYDDCEMWREVATANGIMNPRNVYAGQILKVPAL